MLFLPFIDAGTLNSSCWNCRLRSGLDVKHHSSCKGWDQPVEDACWFTACWRTSTTKNSMPLCRGHQLHFLWSRLGSLASRLSCNWQGILCAGCREEGHESNDHPRLSWYGAALYQPDSSCSGECILPHHRWQWSHLPSTTFVRSTKILWFLLLGSWPWPFRVHWTACGCRQGLQFVDLALHASVKDQPLCGWQCSSRVEHGNAPVELNMSLPKNNSGGTSFNISYQFGPLKATPPVPEQFEKPQICDKPAPPCENGRGLDPVVLDAYIFHPGMTAGDYNIEDQNVADLAGDAIFICVDRLQKETSFIDHNYTLISRYHLEVSPAFGQYALCNGYPDTKPPGPSCSGGDSRLVGRQAPSSVGEGESRCAADNPLGFWFTLPKGGRCPPGQRPSRDAWASGCTWSVQKRLKTIQQSCLLKEHGFLKYCMADAVERKGFARTNQVLQAAFASEDPSTGGCADVGGPGAHGRSESMVVV